MHYLLQYVLMFLIEFVCFETKKYCHIYGYRLRICKNPTILKDSIKLLVDWLKLSHGTNEHRFKEFQPGQVLSAFITGTDPKTAKKASNKT